MEIAIHLGLHCTDDDKLLRGLLNNRDALLADGIGVPGPGRYRVLIKETLQRLRGQPAGEDAQDVLLDAILDSKSADRVVLSNDQFLGVYGKVLGQNQLYPQAGERVRALRALFPDHEVEFHLAVRDLATFLPACFRASRVPDFTAFMGVCDLRQLSWCHMLERMRTAVPDAPIIVWANEDTPMIWPDVLAAVSGHSEAVELTGTEDILQDIMQPAGFRRMQDWLAKNPPVDAVARRKVVTAFLTKYVDDDALEEDVALPGWTDKVVTYLSGVYDDDLAACAALDGVTVIEP